MNKHYSINNPPPDIEARSNDIITEASVATLFCEKYKGELLHDHNRGRWYVWTGTYWRQEETGLALHLAIELAREVAEDQGSRDRLRICKTGFASAVERAARVDREFAIGGNVWDQDTYLLGTPG